MLGMSSTILSGKTPTVPPVDDIAAEFGFYGGMMGTADVLLATQFSPSALSGDKLDFDGRLRAVVRSWEPPDWETVLTDDGPSNLIIDPARLQSGGPLSAGGNHLAPDSGFQTVRFNMAPGQDGHSSKIGSYFGGVTFFAWIRNHMQGFGTVDIGLALTDATGDSYWDSDRQFMAGMFVFTNEGVTEIRPLGGDFSPNATYTEDGAWVRIGVAYDFVNGLVSYGIAGNKEVGASWSETTLGAWDGMQFTNAGEGTDSRLYNHAVDIGNLIVLNGYHPGIF